MVGCKLLNSFTRPCCIRKYVYHLSVSTETTKFKSKPKGFLMSTLSISVNPVSFIEHVLDLAAKKKTMKMSARSPSHQIQINVRFGMSGTSQETRT